MPFNFKKLEIPDLILIEPVIFGDERGFFAETYKFSDFEKVGIKYQFVQDNHSKSKKNILRGLHYQLNPGAQGKLVRVIKGSVFDVAVDIRKGSPYYKKWVSIILSNENKNMFWVPPGFAHGFLVLEDDTEVFYKATAEYSQQLDRGILWNDTEIGIKWPVENPVFSEKDVKNPLLCNAENNFVYKKES